MLILVRSTLLALDQANKTGNYTVLRDLGAPGFQANTAARLAEIFAKQRSDNLDLSGVAVIDPQLTLLPQIEANGMMRMAGFFPSVPTQVNFELTFAPVNGQWRLFGISVSIGQSGPAAPEPPAPQPRTQRPLRRPSRLAGNCPHGQRSSAAAAATTRASDRRCCPIPRLKSMNVMFATPCYISAVTMNYVASIFSLTLRQRMHLGLQCMLHLHSAKA